jgi:hypothetical protein
VSSLIGDFFLYLLKQAAPQTVEVVLRKSEKYRANRIFPKNMRLLDDVFSV